MAEYDIYDQIVLYCKGHFVEHDIIIDVKTMLANYYGLEVKSISNNRVFEEVMTAYIRHAPHQSLERVFIEMFRNIKEHDAASMTRWLSGKIANIKVREGDKVLVDLPKADPSLLPVEKVAQNIIGTR